MVPSPKHSTTQGGRVQESVTGGRLVTQAPAYQSGTRVSDTGGCVGPDRVGPAVGRACRHRAPLKPRSTPGPRAQRLCAAYTNTQTRKGTTPVAFSRCVGSLRIPGCA